MMPPPPLDSSTCVSSSSGVVSPWTRLQGRVPSIIIGGSSGNSPGYSRDSRLTLDSRSQGQFSLKKWYKNNDLPSGVGRGRVVASRGRVVHDSPMTRHDSPRTRPPRASFYRKNGRKTVMMITKMGRMTKRMRKKQAKSMNIRDSSDTSADTDHQKRTIYFPTLDYAPVSENKNVRF